MHYARVHRALATLDKQSAEKRAALLEHLRTGPASLAKVLAKGPVGAVLGAISDLAPPDNEANLAVWTAVAQQLPEDTPADVAFQVASDLREAGDAEAALPLIEAYIESDGADDADAWLELGDARVALGDAQGALDAWERSCELDDELYEPWARRGYLYSEIGMPGAAVPMLSEAAARDDDPELWLALGRCLVAVGVDDEARQALEKAIVAFDEGDPLSLYMRGAAKALIGDADGAFDDLMTLAVDGPEILASAAEDDDYLRLSEHPRWASVAG